VGNNDVLANHLDRDSATSCYILHVHIVSIPIMTLHNRVTIIIQTNNCRFEVRRNDIYIFICSAARRNTVGFSWIEQKKVTRPKSHGYSNPWECKVTYDSIIDLISVVVNVSLNNRHSKIRIDTTFQVNINSKAKSVVITCFFCLMRRVMAPLL
jgi:hypothetical protein